MTCPAVTGSLSRTRTSAICPETLALTGAIVPSTYASSVDTLTRDWYHTDPPQAALPTSSSATARTIMRCFTFPLLTQGADDCHFGNTRLPPGVRALAPERLPRRRVEPEHREEESGRW